ncbi:hypothetical protein [Gallaecimonas pentaromativorans]|uniref:Papain like cysteine protease AvrRpt2 n=1 Tax=Gallaecimonas pentaromativorans TaxID=584787 RepID=A0A3N1PI09_9GAMM|nr:hypothetical protein [Gallaecimonas pentaromativorans]ROQ24196.1 hypothetical protein EDC28_10777 [Gallaecimonas pentaromativorans]
MPNINLTTLAWVPNVNQASMTQPEDSNQCGAFALVAAVGAFGAFTANTVVSYQNAGPGPVNNQETITTELDFTGLSQRVYNVTGILNHDLPAPDPELINGGDYNSPAAMAKVIADLGRPQPRVNVQQDGYQLLNALYPGETARCQQVVGAGNVNTDAGQYGAPANGETHIVCVNVNDGGLHCLARGSDGHFYDPADGTLNNNWNPVNTGDAMGAHYTFSGLWIVIT